MATRLLSAPPAARLSHAARRQIRRPPPAAPLRQAACRQWGLQRCRKAAAVEARRGGSGGGGPRRGRPQQPVRIDPRKLVGEYALPALGLLAVASLVGPLVGGLVMGALSLGVMLAAGAAALSFSWILIPLFAAVFGLPALMGAGVFATAAAGALLLPGIIQLGLTLALIGGGLWLGSAFAGTLFGPSAGSAGIDPDGTIDVEAETLDDDWRDEWRKEQQEREQELREFDDLLRRREDFKRGGRGPY